VSGRCGWASSWTPGHGDGYFGEGVLRGWSSWAVEGGGGSEGCTGVGQAVFLGCCVADDAGWWRLHGAVSRKCSGEWTGQDVLGEGVGSVMDRDTQSFIYFK
jgi:hypothetical protein